MTTSRDDIDGILNTADGALSAIDPLTPNADTRINKIRSRAQLAFLANIAIELRIIRAILEQRRL